MVICSGYEFSPNMIDIQEGYNKNFDIKCIGYYEKFDFLWLFWEILVLKIMSPKACTYGEPLCDEVGAWFVFW